MRVAPSIRVASVLFACLLSVAAALAQTPSKAPATRGIGSAPEARALRILRLTIVPSSASVDVGEIVRMRAIATMSDGTESRVGATWTASGGTISGDGAFVAQKEMNRVTVTATRGGQSATAVIKVTSPPSWRTVVLIVAALAGVAIIAKLAWQHFRPATPSAPPLSFTYDYERLRPETEIFTSGGHGVELALVSSAGDSEQFVEPYGVKLFDETKSYEEKYK